MENVLAVATPLVNTREPAFGEVVTDHMLVANYEKGAWQTGALVPFGNLSLSPVTMALHYGQSVFEGMKAFRTEHGDIALFRPEKHWERLNISLERMCMPMIPKSIFMEGLEKLLHADRTWLPGVEEGALYIRPLVFATDARFGYQVSKTYCLIIVCGPVGSYFAKPLKVRVETEFVRAAEGGTGYAKCAGNYGGALYPTERARKAGFDQVLWTDSKEHKYIEESGVMNVMFVINQTLVTPPLTSTILDGVTRDSVIRLAQHMKFPVEERKISVEEIEKGLANGQLTEAFGAGTAATIAPIATIGISEKLYSVPASSAQSISMQILQTLSDIRYGRIEDIFQWNHIVR